MTLYDRLGVGVDASAADIHTAYRNLAKTCHPDVGGDPAQFEAIRRAHDILVDPERRGRYDRTGEEIPVEADNAIAQILTFLSATFEDVCRGLQKTQEKLEEVDVIQRMVIRIRQHQQELGGNISTAEADADNLRKLAERFSTKDGSVNYMKEVVLGKERMARSIAEKMRGEIAMLDKVADLLGVYAYRANPPTIGREFRIQDPWFRQAAEFQAAIFGRQNPGTSTTG